MCTTAGGPYYNVHEGLLRRWLESSQKKKKKKVLVLGLSITEKVTNAADLTGHWR